MPLAERTADLAAELPEDLAPEPAEQNVLALAASMDDLTGTTDEEQIADLARRAHGPDILSAHAWLAYLETQTRALIAADAGKIERLAAVLAAEGELGADAIKAVLAA